ncbi:MAG: hypothetical protein ACJZ78_07125, partial [Prochlorococcus marinus]
LKFIGRYEDAISNFNQASDMEPKNPKYYEFRGLKLSDFYRDSLNKNRDLIETIDQCDWKNSKRLLEKLCKEIPEQTEANVSEFIKIWCDYLKNLVDEGSPRKILPVLVNIITIDKRNRYINKLLKHVFERFELSLLQELAENKDEILLNLGYGQYKFLEKDFSEAELVASNNIKEAEILIKSKETEDLGWLIVSRSLVLFKQKNIARNSLINLINSLNN